MLYFSLNATNYKGAKGSCGKLAGGLNRGRDKLAGGKKRGKKTGAVGGGGFNQNILDEEITVKTLIQMLRNYKIFRPKATVFNAKGHYAQKDTINLGSNCIVMKL